MRKIPVVFAIDYVTETLLPTVRPDCEWVLEGQGIATLKTDGSACLYRNGQLWRRLDRKLNKQAQKLLDQGRLLNVQEKHFRVKPDGFEPCEPACDPVTYHWPGWVPVSATNPNDCYHLEALANCATPLKEGQTYELVGPTLADNPYEFSEHCLLEHGAQTVELTDRSFEGLRTYLENHYIEGVVFHHPDGRMAKIRRKDYKLFWVKDQAPRRKRTPSP